MSLAIQAPVSTMVLFMMAAVAARAATPDTEVVLPCPALKSGNAWKHAMPFAGSSATRSTVVLANDGKRIVLGERTTLDADLPGMPGSAAARLGNPPMEIELEDRGPVVVRRFATIDVVVKVLTEPPDPFCGKMPSQWVSTTQTIVNGVSTATLSVTSVRARGKERITVPAGTFDATVVEFTTLAQPDPVGASGQRTVTVIHAVEDVGFVRIARTTTFLQQQSATNPQAEALLQEGIRKMQKGEDASDVMRQLAALPSAENVNASAGMKEHRNEVVVALQSFDLRR